MALFSDSRDTSSCKSGTRRELLIKRKMHQGLALESDSKLLNREEGSAALRREAPREAAWLSPTHQA